MKPVDVKAITYIDFDVENNNNKDPQFKVGAHVRISKYKNIFGNWLHSKLVRSFCY